MARNSEIIKTIKNYTYVSFDIFDTLIKRNIAQPSDIFMLIQIQGGKMFGNEAKTFVTNRIKAEAILRKQDSMKEVTLREIYSTLSDIYSKQFLDWAYKYELELELRFANTNYELKDVYDYCVRNNKKIQIITDIYLPQSHIIKMLHKVGVNKWDHIWVSSNIKKTKATGELFDYVLDRLQINGKQMIHIGDNEISDYKNAEKRHIKAIKIRTYNNNLNYSKYKPGITMDENILISFMNNNVLSIDDNQKVGFETLGPLLLGFSKWLTRNLQKLNITNVYFMSRDGWIMKKAFDLMNDEEKIKTHYFYASRRAFQVPAISYDLKFDSFIKRINWPQKISLRYFLESLGIENKNDLLAISKKYSVPLNLTITFSMLKSNDNIFETIFENEKYFIKKISEREEKLLLEYIKQSGLKGKIAIIDIGWHGNMQMNLVDTLNHENIDVDVYGFYMGVDPFVNHKDKVKMYGYMFDEMKNEKLYLKINNVIDVFEQSFMAPHGSVRKYKSDCGKIVPSLYSEEQTNSENRDFLLNYQMGALKLIKLINEFDKKSILSLSVSTYGIIKLFTSPQYTDAINWGHLMFKNVKVQEMVIKSKKNYLFHPQKFLLDYNKSVWKEGFLKQVFKVNIDYYKLIKKVGNIKDKVIPHK